MLYMKEMRAKVVAECTLKESAAINQILGRRVSISYSNANWYLHFALIKTYDQKKKKSPTINIHHNPRFAINQKKKNIHQNFLKNNPLKFPEMKDNFRNWTNRVWFFVQSQSIRWFNWKQPKFLSKISIDNSKRKHFKPFDFFQFKNPIFYVKFLF